MCMAWKPQSVHLKLRAQNDAKAILASQIILILNEYDAHRKSFILIGWMAWRVVLSHCIRPNSLELFVHLPAASSISCLTHVCLNPRALKPT